MIAFLKHSLSCPHFPHLLAYTHNHFSPRPVSNPHLTAAPHPQVVVADVPFVDLMNTMCDPTIPLTMGEWEEWGNPNEVV